MQSRCQRLLTYGKWAGGGVLERLEGLVLLEALGEVLCAVWTELVLLEIERLQGRVDLERLSKLLDTRRISVEVVVVVVITANGVALQVERLERRVCLESLGEVLCGLRVEVVGAQIEGLEGGILLEGL